MGTWGTGPFDNDTAADLIAKVVRAGPRGWKHLAKVVAECVNLDTGDGVNELVAVAEIVNWMKGHGKHRPYDILAGGIPPSFYDWVDRYGKSLPRGMATNLAAELKKVAGSKGFARGWANPSQGVAWRRNVLDVARRLRMKG